jgi:adenylosuccinate synthase
MPVSVVVGGQFGSEGKGKVALEIARQESAVAVVRVGGTNSGHTVIDADDRPRAFRQLPACAIAHPELVVLPPGSYIDLAILQREIQLLGLRPGSLLISPMARIITEEHKRWEREAGLTEAIGSTGSGTGAAVLAMIARSGMQSLQASDCPELREYLGDTTAALRSIHQRGRRIVVEGTQGFGLSVLHGGYWPKATSRDTTAAGFIAETGLSPLYVDDVTLVIRAFPIRVAGDSGPLPNETTWDEIALQAGLPKGHYERTTVTQKVRRVGRFDPEIVKRAIAVNEPTRVVLNHLDYVHVSVRKGEFNARVRNFVSWVEQSIGRPIDWVGTGPSALIKRDRIGLKTDWSRPRHDEVLIPS